jgi:hypothetical protein
LPARAKKLNFIFFPYKSYLLLLLEPPIFRPNRPATSSPAFPLRPSNNLIEPIPAVAQSHSPPQGVPRLIWIRTISVPHMTTSFPDRRVPPLLDIKVRTRVCHCSCPRGNESKAHKSQFQTTSNIAPATRVLLLRGDSTLHHERCSYGTPTPEDADIII